MAVLTYKALKARYILSESLFRDELAADTDRMKDVIATLAKAPIDCLWPLAMLITLHPEFGHALDYWSSGGYEEIRQAQEADMVETGTHANHMETNFSLLPQWRGKARHFSKDSSWFKRLECGTLELQSFMSCCSPGHSYAYVVPPAAVLEFSSLRSARLIGALSLEHSEGEVLLPKGAAFRVVSVRERSKTICLEECPPG